MTGEQDVAALDSGGRGRRSRHHFSRDDTFRPRAPEDAVLHLMRLRAKRDVGDAQDEQHSDDGEREKRPSPDDPARRLGARTRHVFST